MSNLDDIKMCFHNALLMNWQSLTENEQRIFDILKIDLAEKLKAGIQKLPNEIL